MVKEKKTLEEKVSELTSLLGDEEERAKQLSKTKNKYEAIIAELERKLQKEQEASALFTFQKNSELFLLLVECEIQSNLSLYCYYCHDIDISFILRCSCQLVICSYFLLHLCKINKFYLFVVV